MGKVLRRNEGHELEKTFTKLGIPIYYVMHGNATAEAGDILLIITVFKV